MCYKKPSRRDVARGPHRGQRGTEEITENSETFEYVTWPFRGRRNIRIKHKPTHEIIVCSCCGRGSKSFLPKRVPCQTYTRTKQPLRIVLGQQIIRNSREGLWYPVIEKDGLGASVFLAPAVAELVA